MAEQDDQSRTEAPSPRRRKKAREEGQVVSSPDLQSALQLLCGAGLLLFGGEWFVTKLAETTTGYLRAFPQGEWTASHASRMGWSTLADLQRLCLPVVSMVMLAGTLAAIGQSGPIHIVPVKLDWSRLDPRSGWNRLLSWESTVRGLQAIGKAALIASIALGSVTASGPLLAQAGFHTFANACGSAWDVCGRLLLLTSSVTLVLGTLDFGFKWYRHEQKLRQTHQELKEEQKEESGDPHLKAHLRRLQRQASQSKGLDRIQEATVVITNPTHLSIALKYEHGVTSAPIVIAKGEGYFALRIRELAAQHGITTIERKPLVRAMYHLVDVGQEIPFEFYQAIAEILSAVYRLRRS
ncbi:MAG: EscU/YscU/HrcU family type III secretion system export apparatus switch protein [Planctomycetaceae bacterium]|nr:EscU/YscU/HrcU family type III secretion system export apparatus switch protein [Planctomycetaceae bacterium]